MSHYTELRGEKCIVDLVYGLFIVYLFCFTVKYVAASLTLLFSISQSVFQKEAACFLSDLRNYNRFHV